MRKTGSFVGKNVFNFDLTSVLLSVPLHLTKMNWTEAIIVQLLNHFYTVLVRLLLLLLLSMFAVWRDPAHSYLLRVFIKRYVKGLFQTQKPVFNFFFCTSSSFGLLLFVFLCNVEWSTIKYASFKSTLRNSLNYRQTKSCIHYKLQFNSYVANLLGRFNGFIHIFSPFCFLVNKCCVFTMEFRMLRLFFSHL